MTERWKLSGRIAVWLAIWTAIGLIGTITSAMEGIRAGRYELWIPLVYEMTSAYSTAILAPLIMRFTRAHRFSRRTWPGRILQHLGVAVVFSATHTTLMVLMRKGVFAIAGRRYEYGPLVEGMGYELTKDVLTYTAIVLITLVFYYFDRQRRNAVRAAELEAELADARLRLLKEQIQPHFLFNTLNLVSACMYEDVEKADRTLADLSRLLSHTLRTSELQLLPLREEIRMLSIYLGIMKARFGDRLAYEIRVDPECESVEVPTLILQPLVENSIQHGVSRTEGTTKIEVVGKRSGALLRLEVVDDGPGLDGAPGGDSVHGIGLENTRRRLEQLYGRVHRFDLTSRPGGGLCVSIEIPDGTRATPLPEVLA